MYRAILYILILVIVLGALAFMANVVTNGVK